MPQTLQEAEQTAIIAALDATNGNHTKAAQVLGINRSTLLRKIQKYHLRLKAYCKPD